MAADPDGPLGGRAALVTGAAGGIGAAIAARLVDDGADVLAVDLRPEADGPGVPLQADLCDEDANAACVAAAVERFGRLDIVVAGAGVQHVAAVQDFPVARWRMMLDLMVTSPFLLARAAWPALRESGDGRFIALGSTHSLIGSPYKSAYTAAKHGVLGLVKSLALEGAGDGIAAVAVCPGYVRTPLVEGQIAAQAAAHGIPEDEVVEKIMLAPQAVKEMIEPDEVADVVAFLAGPRGRRFTGTPVTMDQGWTAA